MTRGGLEAQVLEGERAHATAPPDVSAQLRLSAQAEADTLAQSADAQARHDHTGAANAQALARQMTTERERLEADDTRYEKWATGTRATREAAGKAKAELHRRGQAPPAADLQGQPEGQPQTMTGWWRQFEVDIAAVERSLGRQHQAAIDAGQPWPPQRTPEPEPPSTPSPDLVPDDRAARLDDLLTRADRAAQRVAARQTERQAGSEYAARIEREAQAEPEAGQQAEARDGAEIER